MKSIFYLFLILLSACETVDKRLKIENIYSNEIVLRFGYLENNKIRGSMAGERKILPGEIKTIEKLYSWESEFKDINYNSPLYIFVFNGINKESDNLRQMTDSLIIKGYFHYATFNIKQLDSINWIVVYPNSRFKSGFKLKAVL